MECRSLLSLLLLALPSSAVASAPPSLSSAVVIARLARVRAAALCDVLLASVVCMPSLSLAFAVAHIARSLACRRSAWRTARCSRWCRRLAFALIGCRCCSHRSRACCHSACCPSLSLQSTAQYAVTGCRVGLSLPSFSSTVAVAQLTRLLTAALCGAPLAALAAVVGYAIVGCCVGLAVALISVCRCSPRS